MRPNKHEYFMNIAEVVSTRSECCRRSVGAVIVDIRGRILATGTNGLAPGRKACGGENKCKGASCQSGTGLDLCEASHAEISALVSCHRPYEATTLYVTTAPCVSCVKAILLSTIETIYYRDDYPSEGKELWERDGGDWIQL